MTRFQPNVFRDHRARRPVRDHLGFKERDYRFVQICAMTLEDSCELLYTFIAPTRPTDASPGLS